MTIPFTEQASAIADPAHQPDSSTFTGTEFATIQQGGSIFKTTLTKVAQWVLQTYQGFTQSGAGAVSRPVQDKLRESISVSDFGAKGDGATLDDAAFSAFELLYIGRIVDLRGLTYAVTAAPTKNAYHNGVFKVSGNTLQAALFSTFASSKSKFHAYGGQLRALHKALCNPLEQQTTIGFFGDSITWGLSLPENAASTPRSGTLADPRDNFASASWVNQLKRFIGSRYFDGAAPVLSNWSYSTAGQSTATYSRTERLYTNLPPFTINLGSATNQDSKTAGALLGYRNQLGINPTGSTAEVSFTFTGTSFNLVYTSITAASDADYELFVDGVSQGTFSTYTTPSAFTQRRTHTFGYVRNKIIKIAARYPAAGSGVAYLNLEAIEIIKQCSIVNQGVIGTDAYAYQTYNFGAQGPTSMTPDLNYVFLQLGTNDRLNTMGNYNQPLGINSYKKNMNALLAKIAPTAAVVLMNAGPAANESPATYAFDMQDVRNMVGQLGSDNAMDVVDNYTIFAGIDLSTCLADGLHPNLLGHAMVAQNIINALESA